MAIIKDGKMYANLEEQVQINKDNIEAIKAGSVVLAEFGIRILEHYATVELLPTVDQFKLDHPEWQYGDSVAIGPNSGPQDLYILTRADATHENDYWLNVGEFPRKGDQGPQGEDGENGEDGADGTDGTDGTCIYYTSSVLNSGTGVVNISTISIPSGYSLKVGDFLLGNENVVDNGHYISRVTSVDTTTANVASVVFIANGETEVDVTYDAGDGLEKVEGTTTEYYFNVLRDEDTIVLDTTHNHLKVNTNVIQPKLTAGQNITIQNNVISATGGGASYTAGYGIDIDSNNVISVVEDEFATLEDLDEKQDVLTAGTGIDITSNTVSVDNTIALKSEIPTVPTNVSAFTNDAGYLTEHQSLSAYRTASAQDVIDVGKQDKLTAGTGIDITNNTIGVNNNVAMKTDIPTVDVTKSYVDTELAKKQNNLTAGANITINNDVISATSTSYTAGANIDITNNVISATDTKYTAGNGLDLSGTQFAVDTDTIATVDYVDQSVTGLATTSEVEDAVEDAVTECKSYTDQKVVGVYIYKGSVPNYASLPVSVTVSGWVYNTEDTGMNYASVYAGGILTWDPLGMAFVPYQAGTNITISGNTISATDTTYSAGSGISLVGTTFSVDNTVALKSEIPTKTSDLTNDSGFLTEHQSLAAYRTAAAQDTIDSGKQDTISDLANIRSGASAGATALQPDDNVSELVNDAGYLTEHQSLAAYRTSADQDVIDATFAVADDLAEVATSGDYNDLSNKPTIPAAQIQSDWNQTNTSALDYIKNKPTIPSPVTYTAGDGIYINGSNEISARVGVGLFFDDNDRIALNNASQAAIAAVSGKSTVSGTNDGTNWTTITVDGTTYSIPGQGGTPSNMVTTDTEQTISGAKTFTHSSGISYTQNNKTVRFREDGIYNSTDNQLYTYPSSAGTLALTSQIPTIPSNYVTTNTSQDVSGLKTFTTGIKAHAPLTVNDQLNPDYTYLQINPTYMKKYDIGNEYTYSLPASTGTLALTSDIPTNISSFTNDSGYITSNALSTYAQKTASNTFTGANTFGGNNYLTIKGTGTSVGIHAMLNLYPSDSADTNWQIRCDSTGTDEDTFNLTLPNKDGTLAVTSQNTYQTTAPTAAITDGGIHIVYLTSEPTTKYSGYIYLIAE